jgi:EmrB/QacA subfamily drug resistance transporter
VLTSVFPGKERGRALGLQATMTYLGLATGPAFGGLIAQHWGWPYIFFINIPIGAVAIPASVIAIRRESSKSDQPFDPAGAVTLALALASLLFALNKGNDMGWGSPLVAASVAVAVVASVGFIVIERRVEHPVLDLKLFSNRFFGASTAAAFLNYAATSSVNFLMPFYLISACGYKPAVAGMILISTPVTMALVAGFAGSLSDKIGYRIPSTLGMAITVIGMFSLRSLHPAAGQWQIIPHLITIGLGVGLFTSPNNSAIMGSAPANRRGVAGAILAAARNIGFAIGTAMAGLIYIMRLDALKSAASDPLGITRAMQDATTVVALLAMVGIAISACRGPGTNR